LKLKNANILWTVYFDSTLTRKQGRRLASKYCVPKPRVGEIQRACMNLGLAVIEERTVKHPRSRWIDSGYVAVTKGNKDRIINEVSKALRELRHGGGQKA